MTTATAVPRRSVVEQVMGLPVSVLVRGADARSDETARVAARVHAELRAVDALFSTWRPDSEISRIGRGELAVERAHLDVQQVLRDAERWRELTEGWFDVHLTGPDGAHRLDPSGLVKGWAVERAARHLDDLPDDWVVNAGGDVVVRAAGPAWRVGVEDPRNRSSVLAVVPLATGAVATSGVAARGQHVQDPRTGAPASGLLSVTVTGPSLCTADVLATAALAEGPAGLARLEAMPGYEAMQVLPDGRLQTTSGWPVRAA